MCQADARTYMPPYSHIWRSNKLGAWHIHVPPHKRAGKSFKAHQDDSSKALVAVLQVAWSQYLSDNALPLGDCPWALFGAAQGGSQNDQLVLGC